MEERIVIITDIKTGLATISGYHPDNYSTQLLISGVNKNVDKLISDHKAVVEIMQKDHARSLWIKDDVIGDLEAIIEEKKKVIMLLKAENYDLTKGIK